MKETKTIAKAANFTAVDFGKMSDIKDYTLQLGPEIKIPGKIFGGQSVNATGGEFSFQSFAPGTETGFLQVDGEVFPIQEGSVVRVAPAGKRSVRNNDTEPLLMLCVQYRGETFTADDTIAADGVILDEKVEW